MQRWPSSLRCAIPAPRIDMVAGAGDALNTQDNVRRDDAEHNDLSHVHNLAQSRTGRLHAQTQVAARDGVSLAPVLDRQSLRLATPPVA